MSVRPKQVTGAVPQKSKHGDNELVHPYILKYEAKERKLMKILNCLYELADNDLIVCDRRTGLNNYDMNLKFATKLESLAKVLVTMSTQCCQKATDIRTKISEAQDRKARKQDDYVAFDGEVVKDAEKCELLQNRKTSQSSVFKSDPDKLPPPPKKPRIPVIWISDDEDDQANETEVYSGDPDTKFLYAKENNNSPEVNKYWCRECNKVFRDSHELRNHEANHRKELFRCLRCNSVSRSERSFANHFQTHTAETYTCPEDGCGQFFTLKSSLSNHMQKHSEHRMHCSICGKEFQYCQSHIEHEKFCHRTTRTVPCPVCKKYFWTPTSMRSHRSKYHTLVSEMYDNEF